jgi:PRTRC genetic system ThiF family protein
MKTQKTKVHFTHDDLLQAVNPVQVILIGAGGTGSQVLTALARMNHTLNALGHAGVHITLWDDDVVTPANQGRQLFADCEVGLNKAVSLINRCNRFFGTDWKAVSQKFARDANKAFPKNSTAAIYITCVDSVAARFEVADMLMEKQQGGQYRNAPRYWLDYGNSKASGQVILSTIGTVKQPDSQQFETVGTLPFVTDEFRELLIKSEKEHSTPSCSLAEALEKQDLFVNSSLAQMGGSLLWNLFRQGMTECRGFFLNLENFRCTPLPLN